MAIYKDNLLKLFKVFNELIDCSMEIEEDQEGVVLSEAQKERVLYVMKKFVQVLQKSISEVPSE